MDGVMGLSAGPASAYANMAAIARFSPSGYIDARNGAAYQAVAQIPYTAGLSYHFRMQISIPNHTYNVFVTPAGGSEQLVGANFAFRSEQSSVTSLDNFAVYAKTGSHQVCNIAISPAPNLANLSGTWTGTLSQGGTFSFFVSTSYIAQDGFIQLGGNPSCPGNNYDTGMATIIGNTFIDYFQGGSYHVTVIGTFNSSSSASGRYRVVDNTPGSSCSVDLTWTTTKP